MEVQNETRLPIIYKQFLGTGIPSHVPAQP